MSSWADRPGKERTTWQSCRAVGPILLQTGGPVLPHPAANLRGRQNHGENFNEYHPPHYGKLYGLTLERLGFHEITVDDPGHFPFIRGQESGGTHCREPPRSLTVPVVGLRLPLERIKLEPFPEDLRVKCPQLYDEEFYTSRVWIFGRASDAARTYYVLTGYFKRLDINPNRKLYEFWDNGAVYTVTGTKCGGDDAGETFEACGPDSQGIRRCGSPACRNQKSAHRLRPALAGAARSLQALLRNRKPDKAENRLRTGFQVPCEVRLVRHGFSRNSRGSWKST